MLELEVVAAGRVVVVELVVVELEVVELTLVDRGLVDDVVERNGAVAVGCFVTGRDGGVARAAVELVASVVVAGSVVVVVVVVELVVVVITVVVEELWGRARLVGDARRSRVVAGALGWDLTCRAEPRGGTGPCRELSPAGSGREAVLASSTPTTAAPASTDGTWRRRRNGTRFMPAQHAAKALVAPVGLVRTAGSRGANALGSRPRLDPTPPSTALPVGLLTSRTPLEGL